MGAAMGGAMGGMGAAGILGKSKGPNGQPQLSPDEQKMVKVFNQQWAQMSAGDHLVILVQKQEKEIQALFMIMTPENKQRTEQEVQEFGKLPDDQKKQHITNAAQQFKAKQQQNQAVSDAGGLSAQEADMVNTIWI